MNELSVIDVTTREGFNSSGKATTELQFSVYFPAKEQTISGFRCFTDRPKLFVKYPQGFFPDIPWQAFQKECLEELKPYLRDLALAEQPREKELVVPTELTTYRRRCVHAP